MKAFAAPLLKFLENSTQFIIPIYGSITACRNGDTSTRRSITQRENTLAMKTATVSMRSTSIPWKGFGRSYVPCCVPIEAFLKKNSQSITAFLSSFITPGVVARLSLERFSQRSRSGIRSRKASLLGTPKEPWNFLDYDQPLNPSAARYEGGTPNLSGIAALVASLDVLDTASARERAEHILALTDYLVEALLREGAELHSVRSAESSSGIVTFSLPGVDPSVLGERCVEAGVVVTARANSIRVFPHAYSTREEVDRLLEVAGGRR